MVQMYLAGHLSREKPDTIEGVLREELILDHLAMKCDAEAELEATRLNAHFAMLFQDPKSQREKMFSRLQVLSALQEGDTSALWRAVQRGNNEGELEALRELWRELHEGGML